MANEMVTLEDLAAVLSAHSGRAVQIILPNRSQVPVHFHVTEVGRVQKHFIDCGGTARKSESCTLQVWTANDVAHRLDTTKLSGIINKGKGLFESTAIPLEVEYDNGLISQYPVERVEVSPSCVVLHLGTKHAACLAPDRCGVALDLLPSCSEPGCC